MRWTGHTESMGERRGTCQISVGESEAKRQLASTRLKWEYNLELDLQEMEWRHELDLIWYVTETGDGLL